MPNSAQLVLTAIPATNQPDASRGTQPPSLPVPTEGILVIGHGVHGITDPHMSERHAALSMVKTAHGARLQFHALGRNDGLYRTATTGTAWQKLKGHGQEGNTMVLLRGGDELCFLKDESMHYTVSERR